MNYPSFSDESLQQVEDLLGEDFACGSAPKSTKPRSPAQQAADAARSQKMKGRKSSMSAAARSAAAKKGAATRKNCK